MNKISNVLFFGLLAFVLYQRVPSIIEHWRIENTEAPVFQVSLLSKQSFDLEQHNKKLILIFWATWCGPCEVELKRINSLIEDGSVAPDNVLAVASYEDLELVRNVVLQRQYRFSVGLDFEGKVGNLFKVKGTPTVVLVDSDRKIHWVTTGLSPLLSVRLKKFLATP